MRFSWGGGGRPSNSYECIFVQPFLRGYVIKCYKLLIADFKHISNMSSPSILTAKKRCSAQDLKLKWRGQARLKRIVRGTEEIRKIMSFAFI